MTDYELAWKRNPDTGSYLATDSRDGATYTVSRDHTGRGGWMLTADLPGQTAPQTRRGFSHLALAQRAALETRCARCYRHRPFAALDETGRNGVWTCRDRAECEEIEAARDEESRRVTREIRNEPWDETRIRDTPDGPELLITPHGPSRYVIQATEGDLLRLSYVLLTWFRNHYAAELAKVTEAMRQAGS